MIRIAGEPFDSPAATALRDRHQAELIERYGWDTEPGRKPTAADVPVFLVAREDGGEAVGCGGLRPIGPGLVEIKRMYVLPTHRGSGVGRLLLAALEGEARALGAQRVVLETGSAQHEAVGLYESNGYRPIPCYGAYAASAISLCYERVLGPRPSPAGEP